MSTEAEDGDRNAEVVPLHPEQERSAPGAPEMLAAVPGREIELAAGRSPAVPVYADITRAPGDRLPVIPEHWRGRANIRATLTLYGAQSWHRAKYHSIRSPWYLLLAAWCIVAGVLRVAALQIGWWWHVESHGLRSAAAAAGDSREWMRLHKEAREVRKVRGIILALELAALAIGAGVLVKLGPWWSRYAALAAAVVAFMLAGRPADRRIISAAIIPPDYSPPTHAIITDALGSLGIPEINKALKPPVPGGVAPGIRYVSDVMKDGPGWTCHLDLPRGVTATQILARREELASGLRRPLSATWPAAVPAEHAGRLELWVGFHDISKAKPARWPLARAGTADVFDSLPFGTDPRGRPAGAPMFECNWLIGAAPGQGKSAAVRVLALGCALDVTADLWTHELAGKGDQEALARVSHRYVSGLDDDSIAYAAESARLLRAELERRSKRFGKVPGDQKPDKKLTRELAVRYRELRPLVAIFDEAQNMFMHPEHGKQAADDLAHVIRLGRALGIIVILATQRPDATSLPTSISGIVTARFCLKVPDQPANDMILGTSSYKAGYNAAIFRLKTDAGLGWLKSEGEPQIVRTYYLDGPAAEKIAERARVMRDRAGVLTGYALGEGEDLEARDVLADVAAVFGDAIGLHWSEAADRLAERWPDRWADISAETLSAQLRALGVPSVDVKRSGVTLKGCRKVGVDRAVSQR
jgi:DNA segregation ATPase FtsK/SpoIIIE, S-DNA-T family